MTRSASAKGTLHFTETRWGVFVRFCTSVLLVLAICGCGFVGSSEKQQKKADAPAEVTAENPLPYTVSFEVRDEDGVKSGGKYLAGRLKDASQLERLKKSPPDGELGLERRAKQDLAAAEKLMRSEGYYDGRAELSVSG